MTTETSLLIIDDNLINRQYFSMALAKKNYKVQLAEDGFVAIEKAKENDFHLILTDIKMPVIDGYETTKQIKQIPRHKNTPFIATSAETIAEENRELFVKTLLKPIKLQQLYKAVAEFCPHHKKILDFDKKHALAFAYDDEKIMHKMVSMFVQQLPEQMQQLQHLINSKKNQQTYDFIHKIRGSCKACGAVNLDNKLASLSQALKSQNENKNKNHINTELYCSHMLKAYRDYLDCVANDKTKR